MRLTPLLGWSASILFFPAALEAQSGGLPGHEADILAGDYRSIDGSENNPIHEKRGEAGEPFVRLAPADYADGVSAPSGASRPSARMVSSAVAAQSGVIPNSAGLSDMFWQWGQFLDHDLDETPGASPEVAFDIPVPMGDPWFDPFSTGTEAIPMNRSFQEMHGGVAQQVNEITSWIDASNVYGSDPLRAFSMRTLDGTGRMKVSAGNHLPFNTTALPNAPDPLDATLYLAGDVRANEQIGLISMHTLWVREHNKWATFFGNIAPQNQPGAPAPPPGSNPNQRPRTGSTVLTLDYWTGETIYQLSRAMVTAEIQSITYNEFLPLLLGPNSLPAPYFYDPTLDPTISNEFATAAYRFGHTMLPESLLLRDAMDQPVAGGSISLADAFFTPTTFESIGIDAIVHGQLTQLAQELDAMVTGGIRNFLFGPPGAGGLDLASLNIQRGRDHGIPGLNGLRQQMGLPVHTTFNSITVDQTTRDALASVYTRPEDVDAWIGGLAEDHVPGAVVGETFHAILVDQFHALRSGDRFWYERYLPQFMIPLIEAQTLAVVIRRNTGLGAAVQSQAFMAN